MLSISTCYCCSYYPDQYNRTDKIFIIKAVKDKWKFKADTIHAIVFDVEMAIY